MIVLLLLSKLIKTSFWAIWKTKNEEMGKEKEKEDESLIFLKQFEKVSR